MHSFRPGVWVVTLVLTLAANGQQPVGDSNSAQSSGSAAAEVQPGRSRAITFRVTPQYPRLAASLKIFGAVHLQAIVRADGTVKQVRVVGGHPVLADAAVAAVMKWRFEVAARETTESVKVNFGQ